MKEQIIEYLEKRQKIFYESEPEFWEIDKALKFVRELPDTVASKATGIVVEKEIWNAALKVVDAAKVYCYRPEIDLEFAEKFDRLTDALEAFDALGRGE